MQLQAAYVIEELEDHLTRAVTGQDGAVTVRALWRELSWFEVTATNSFEWARPEYDATGPHALWTVAANLLARGLPTRAPLALAAATLAENWPEAPAWLNAAGQVDLVALDPLKRGSLGFALPPAPATWNALLWRALHPLDPRLTAPMLGNIVAAWRSSGGLDSDMERNFAAEVLPQHGGAAFLTQLLAPQTALPELLRWSADEDEFLRKHKAVSVGDFTQQAADFAIAFPYPWRPADTDAVHGLVLEVDGPHHKEPVQLKKDYDRDRATLAAHWLSVRLPVDEWPQANERLAPVREVVKNHPYFAQLQTNAENPLPTTEEGRRALQLTLGPLAVARVQRTLLEALLNGTIPLSRLPATNGAPCAPLRLAVVERDVPCAQQGVVLLLKLLTQLYTLEGRGRGMPIIDLHVFPAADFTQPTLLTHPGTVVMEPDIDPHPDDCYDLVLDVSVLQRPGFSQAPDLAGVPCLTVRTAHAARGPRRLRSAPLIAYAPLTNYDPAHETYKVEGVDQEARKQVLEELVQDIFRKSALRTGQLPIISRGLQGKSVLGLLPTGGGKSLTFQMAALLQPGVALVVVPIKSLMQDQFEGLNRNWIDAATYLNSSVKERMVKDHRLRQLAEGELFFLYVSPERLVIKEDFRDHLLRMRVATPRVAFSYCVIDEAHCVSEWGHDFRTPYLKLGDNARRFCGTYTGQPVPLYGLTATASFDVLADVQRELQLDDDQSAIIRTATMARPELHVRVLAADVPDKSDRKTVAFAKHTLLNQVLAEVADTLLAHDAQPSFIPDESDRDPRDRLPPIPKLTPWEASGFFEVNPKTGFYPQAGLVFCPHRKGSIGVRDRQAELSEAKQSLAVGYFMGAEEEEDWQNQPGEETEETKMQQMQTAFVAGKLNLMVATKAFGMGIDKPNVRFTVHYGYPGSIESFVQEAGRAGRDRAVALNYLLYHQADDRDIQNFFFHRSFRERKHEELVLHELLTEITFPASECAVLNAVLAEAFPDLTIRAKLVTPKGATNPQILSINGPYPTGFGYIKIARPDSLEGNIEREKPAAPAPVAQQVVNTAMSFLLLHLPAAARDSLAKLVQALGGGVPASIPGILPYLEKFEEGQMLTEPLVIGFSNGIVRELSEEATHYGLKLLEPMLNKCALDSTSSAKFVNEIKANATDQFGGVQLPVAYVKVLEKKFDHIRLEADTFKAVHRLCLMGLVTDYTIQYSAKTVTLHLAPKQSDTQLRTTFQHYLARYTTPERAQAKAAAVADRVGGATYLEKLLGALLDFNDEEIRDKRLRSLDAMDAACQEGLKGENLSAYFDLYFNSKYAKQEFLPKATKQGKDFDKEVVWEYLAYMTAPPDRRGKERDNIKHLRGACARLLSASPHNGAFMLLGAFATLFLELTKERAEDRVETLVALAQAQLLAGFEEYDSQKNLPLTELVAFVKRFAHETGTYDKRIGDYVTTHVEEPLQLKLHLRWLQAFNQRFNNLPALSH